MNAKEHISELVRYCHMIHGKGLVSSSGGNVSIRAGGNIYITPSGRSLQLITEEDIVSMDLQGRCAPERGARPSKEWMMHLGCYQYEDVRAVIHVHSPYAVALSCLRELDFKCAMPVYTAGYAMRVGELPVAPYYPSGSAGLAAAASRLIAGRDSVLLENHGVLAVGETLELALNIAEEIEENARVYFILQNRGKALTGEQMSGYKMGKNRQRERVCDDEGV